MNPSSNPVIHPKQPDSHVVVPVPEMSAPAQQQFDPNRSRRDRDREARKRAEQDAFLRTQAHAAVGGVRPTAVSGTSRDGRPLSAPGEEYMTSTMPGQRRAHHRSNSQHANVNQTQTLGRSRGARFAGGVDSPDNNSDLRLPDSNGNVHRRSPVQQAFERWETLSSHWEGLTGFWIRQLELNTDQFARTPAGDVDGNNSVMSRQISDLSAAGANLFHAVVELQRLRSSSEKKFQKWYYETRTQQDELKAVIMQLEAQARREAEEKLRAIEKIRNAELEKTKAEGLLAEVKRELQISREEARRAWEELGRREQEERERVMNLRSGQPTIVGGVQVVPMQAAFYGQMGRSARPDHVPGNPPYPTGDHGYDARTQMSMSPVTTDPYAGATPEMNDPRSVAYEGPTGLGITSDIDAARSAGTIRGVSESMSDIDAGSEYDVMTPGVGAVEAGGVTPKRQRYTESLVSEEDYGTEIEPLHEKYRQNRNYGLTPSEIDMGSPTDDSYVDLPVSYPSQHPQYGASGMPMSMSEAEVRHAAMASSTPPGMPGSSAQQNPVTYSTTRYEIPNLPHSRQQTAQYHTQQETYPEEHDDSFDSAGTVKEEPSLEHSDLAQPESTSKGMADQPIANPPEQKWESMTGRHRHPTRLSAVYEEDERSRTTSGAHSRSVSLASHPE